jgi:hypothetical protein
VPTPLLSRLVLLGLLVVASSGCTGGSSGATPPAPSASTPAASELAGADGTASAFLAALVDRRDQAAYALLSTRARAVLTAEQFAAAREAKEDSARSLGRSYELQPATGSDSSAVVTGEGRLADGTAVPLRLPLVRQDGTWLVDEAPAAY